MFGLVVLILTVALVLVLGVVAIVCSTSNGADWLQRRWRAGGASGADGLAEAADPLGDAVQRRHDGDATQLGGLARHPVDDA